MSDVKPIHQNIYRNVVTGATPNPVMPNPDAIDEEIINRPLAKVVAGVLWGLNKGDRYPLFITFTYLLGCTEPEFMVVQ
ncbi:MAG: hypothetical protein KME25_21615, partial [Symplocastrum torsivum CPER-KK1]|nr:hypothetical protein [Symplocastrum torsivum CPER-KK1]